MGAMIQFNDDPTIKVPNATVDPMMTNRVTGNDVSLYQALASRKGAQQLARCGKVAARGRRHEHLWLRKEDGLQHLLHREGEAGIHSGNVGHSSENKTGYRSHRLGPIQQESHEGFRYAVGFIDKYSRFGAVYPMKSKNEVTAKLQRFIIDVGRPVTFVSDGALEFKSKQFSDLCTSNGIKQEFSAPYTPEENGKIERAWGTVTGMTRCLMTTAGVPKQFWPFVLQLPFN